MTFARCVLPLALLAAAAAMMKPAHAGPLAQESELITLSDAWIAAEVRNGVAALERLLDQGFIVTFASGIEPMSSSPLR